jgi:transmembrane sensor
MFSFFLFARHYSNTTKMQDTDFKVLFQKYLDETISPEEFTQLETFIRNNYPAQEAEALWGEALANRAYAAQGEEDLDVIFNEITKRRPARLGWIKYAAAAAIIVLVVTGGLYRFSKQSPDVKTLAVQDVAPGGNKAMLTLADGSVVTLDSTGNQVIQQGGTAVKQTGGQLTYDGGSNGEAISFNTLTTPKGGQFQVRLSDGTRVWMNAASSLRYPTAFSGHERKVEVTGEVYFEVAKDAAKPFQVQAGNMKVEVLGTHFNINAYDGLSTTLLEGTVKVSSLPQGDHVILQPGQQAKLSDNIKVISNPDVDRIMAWKNGLFNFEGASFKEVMQELERWYDIEVVYAGGVPDIRFGGELSRNKSLAGLIEALRDAEVHFEIKGRQLIVRK